MGPPQNCSVVQPLALMFMSPALACSCTFLQDRHRSVSVLQPFFPSCSFLLHPGTAAAAVSEPVTACHYLLAAEAALRQLKGGSQSGGQGGGAGGALASWRSGWGQGGASDLEVRGGGGRGSWRSGGGQGVAGVLEVRGRGAGGPGGQGGQGVASALEVRGWGQGGRWCPALVPTTLSSVMCPDTHT